MDELVRVGFASSEAEAVSLTALLASAGIDAIYRVTNAGAPHEIIVRAEDAETAREILEPTE